MYNGNYLTIVERGGCLQIHLTAGGREKLDDIRTDHPEWNDDDVFVELFDDIRGNSPMDFLPNIGEEGFGLTDAPGFAIGERSETDNAYTDDVKLWHYPDYMIRSFLEELEINGFVLFVQAGSAPGAAENIESAKTKALDKLDSMLDREYTDGSVVCDELAADIEEARGLVESLPGIDFCENLFQMAILFGEWSDTNDLNDRFPDGTGEAMESAIMWAKQFTEGNKNRVWDGEWMDEIENFFNKKIKQRP
jgi:hypothetical protein